MRSANAGKKGKAKKRKTEDDSTKVAPEGNEETGSDDHKALEGAPSHELDSDDEKPEDVLWVRGRDKALEQKRVEAAARKR